MTARRVILSLCALGGAAALARTPAPRAPATINRIAQAREEIAYRVGPVPVAFALPQGTRQLRVLANVDQQVESPAGGLAVTLRIRTPGGLDRRFPLWAERAVDVAGAKTIFYLDGDDRPSRTAIIGITRSDDAPGSLIVTLEPSPTPAAGHPISASVRVVVREERAAHRGHSLGQPSLGFAPAPHRAQLLASDPSASTPGGPDEGWVKVAASPETPVRHLYFLDQATPPWPAKASPRALPGWHVVALTVQGPGMLILRAGPGGASGRASILNRSGQERTRDVDLPPGTTLPLALDAGLTTVRLDAHLATNTTVEGATAVAGALVAAQGPAHGGATLKPRWVFQDFARTAPAPATPVTFALAGRAPGRELMLRVRGRLPVADDQADARLRWRAVNAAGQTLATGAVPLHLMVAPEDRVTHDDDLIPSQPATVFLWPPAGADAVQLSSDRPLDIAAASPADVAADVDGDTDDGQADQRGLPPPRVRLRYGRQGEHRGFFPVAPINQTDLRAQGRIDRLQFAPRLEHLADPLPRPAPTLRPAGAIPRADLLTPLTHPAAPTTPGLYWPLPHDRETHLGARGGAATLLYLGDQRSASGMVGVAVDGKATTHQRLFSARGKLPLSLPKGAHRLRVTAPAPVALFVNRPVESAAPRRLLSVYPFDRRGGLRVPVSKTSAARSTVGVVLYGAGPAPMDAHLACTIDGGQRHPLAQASLDRTRLQQRMAVRVHAVEEMRGLNVAFNPTWTSDPIFIPLGDDLPAGRHQLSVSASGAAATPVYGRFFLLPPVSDRRNEHARQIHVEITP